jgi:hypothetical protein
MGATVGTPRLLSYAIYVRLAADRRDSAFHADRRTFRWH